MNDLRQRVAERIVTAFREAPNGAGSLDLAAEIIEMVRVDFAAATVEILRGDLQHVVSVAENPGSVIGLNTYSRLRSALVSNSAAGYPALPPEESQ